VKVGEQNRGFTLLELLVVIFIIAILATMATLSIGVVGGDRALDEETKRLEVLIRLASDDAVLGARELGIRFEPGGYTFLTLDPIRNLWVGMAPDDALRRRALPDSISLELEIDDRVVILKEIPESGDPEAVKPQIFFLSSGDISPFVLRLIRETDHAYFTLSIAPDGTLELSALEE